MMYMLIWYNNTGFEQKKCTGNYSQNRSRTKKDKIRELSLLNFSEDVKFNGNTNP